MKCFRPPFKREQIVEIKDLTAFFWKKKFIFSSERYHHVCVKLSHENVSKFAKYQFNLCPNESGSKGYTFIMFEKFV
ncbi:hypothetical protein Anas_06549 [Armadillidium nasatum]|uniref:Uncharacterized protein n=1 Tax=Armadillidium nasatum TaxID=96803 RepID=A0A5N5SYU4_9CRUS|nr:hypothetical protein Anas_06549 [Armadillidium nasatum]